MKLSCLPVSYFSEIVAGRMSVEEWAWEASEAGLDAIDLSILLVRDRDPPSLKATREGIRAAGTLVAMVTTYPDFTHPDPALRVQEAEKLRLDLATCAELGAQLVRVTAGQAHPATGRADGVGWAVSGLLDALENARRLGITLVYENHAKPAVWNYFDFSFPTDVFLDLVEATEGTPLGINFDTANPIVYGDDPLPLLRRVMHRVVSVHASDTAYHGQLAPVVVGEGVVPLVDIFRVLRENDFDGWICIEEASYTGPAGVKAAVANVRRQWDAAGR